MDKKTVQPQLGKNVRTRLQKYLKKMYLNLGKVGFTADKDQSFTKIIPAVVLKTIDSRLGGAKRLCVSGDEATEYCDLIKLFEKDLAIEYLEAKKLEEAFWTLICTASLRKIKGAVNTAISLEIEEFEQRYCKTIETYEILLPLNDFKISHGVVALGDATIESYDYDKLMAWGPDLSDTLWKKIMKLDSSKPMVKLMESGTSINKMVLRASRRTNLLLDAIRSYAPYECRVLREQQLLQKLAVSAFVKNLNTGKAYHTWKQQWCSWEFGWSGENDCLLTQMQEDLESVLRMNHSIRTTIELSMHWLGAAVREPKGELKIVLACTAMETILGAKDNKLKAPRLIKRMVRLNQLLGTSWIDPTIITSAYQLRSDIIHGSIASGDIDKTYTSMRFITIDTLMKVIQFVQKERIQSKKGLLRILNKDLPNQQPGTSTP